jgi:Zinc carboxypeptidase
MRPAASRAADGASGSRFGRMSRRQQRLGLSLLIAAALPPGAAAQTSALVALPAADPPALAARLTALGFDVLPDRAPGGALQLIVTPEELAALAALGLPAEVLARGRPFAEIQAEQAAEEGGTPAGYPTGPEIEAQMAALAAAHPERCVLVDLTQSYGVAPTFEGRHLLALRISDHAALEEDEPAVLVVATHHARELAPPVIALDAAQRLLAGYGSDPQVTAAVDGHEIWIAPLWNPDGYAFVFATDNFWRKNRRPVSGAVGVDLNRNYPFGWSTSCAGSTVGSSETYKGPSPASEAETQTMLAWSTDRHWAKVLDFHSYGQEALWGYACLGHPLDSFLEDEAQALSVAAGYGAVRNPTGEGEEQEWQLATRGAHAFLLEVGTSFQPPYAEALAEAAQVWPGLQWLLARPMPLSGHVTDGCTHLPLEAGIKIAGLSFGNGEAFGSGGPFGRYALFVPAGGWTLTFSAAGYASAVHVVNLPPGGSKTLDIALMPLVPGGCIADVGGGKPGVAGVPVLAAQGTLAPGSPGTLSLTAAAPGALALLVLGLTQLDAPFKGGTLVPWPNFLAGVDTGPAGAVTLPFEWPAGVPAGVEAWLQAWVPDAAATHGLSASNGLQLVAG